jgi:lipid II:glycine glycyltransferase (peptidoglycan interpeptide bridge formation enzyme)
MLSERLRERHSAQPTHRLVEMLALRDLLGDRVTLWTARDRHGDCVAGEWIYDFGHARHGQYGCASEAGRKCFAQDLILFEVIAACAADGVPVFSFGSSTENEGRHVNAGLLSYKASFGAHSVIHPHYELRLA